MNPTPIRSTWRDPIGVKLTDRRITNRMKQGWYGEIAKLKALAKSTNKATKNAAKAKLKQFEGIDPKKMKARLHVAKPTINIEEFI